MNSWEKRGQFPTCLNFLNCCYYFPPSPLSFRRVTGKLRANNSFNTVYIASGFTLLNETEAPLVTDHVSQRVPNNVLVQFLALRLEVAFTAFCKHVTLNFARFWVRCRNHEVVKNAFGRVECFSESLVNGNTSQTYRELHVHNVCGRIMSVSSLLNTLLFIALATVIYPEILK